jgi:hypothetical protein
MKTLALVIVAVLALGLFTASGQAPAQPQGVLGILRPGQPVSLKEIAGRYEIGTFRNGPTMLAHKVIEVGPDYLVVEDNVGVSETRIPVYSIKAVTTVKVGAKKGE